ncbi:MAG: sulfatase-like hydrolase/transferase [Planctomycetota bacterium]
MAKKNLVLFYCDQIRRDALGCYGNLAARTANIDALAARGIRFDNHYATNLVCMPSRASLMTGRYLQAHRVIDNGIALPRTEVTLAQTLAEAGYVTHAVGKMHLEPWGAPAELGYEESFALQESGRLDAWDGPYYGFERLELALGHGESAYRQGGHYGRWVRRNFPEVGKLLGPRNADGPKCPELQCYRSRLPVEAHHSTWVARRAVEFLKTRGEEPFFLFVSFPDPHHPFTPPARYAEMFEGTEFPGPYRVPGENDGKPEHYRRAMRDKQHPMDGGAHRPPALTDEVLRMVLGNTCGMVTLMDECIGKVLAQLEASGLADETVVIFTADHGDLLGDHYFLFKGPYPCRSLLHLPFVLFDPELGSAAYDAVISNIDVMPTALELLGVPVPSGVQGVSFAPLCRGEGGEPREGALESGWSKDGPQYYHHTLYRKDARISYFYNQRDGELYDLAADGHEHRNLFHDAGYANLREEMLRELFEAVLRAEPPNVPVVAPW